MTSATCWAGGVESTVDWGSPLMLPRPGIPLPARLRTGEEPESHPNKVMQIGAAGVWLEQ